MRRLAILLAFTFPLYATKPCPPPPCFDQPSGMFNRAKCDNLADWQAIGHITKLVHHPAGYPLQKDFATFTFVVEHWVRRGSDRKIKEIPFQVGWCRNVEVMTSDYGGYMFWGRNKPDVPNAEWEYLHFERCDIPTSRANGPAVSDSHAETRRLSSALPTTPRASRQRPSMRRNVR